VWGTYAVDLPVGWEACDDYGYFLQVAGGGGPSASFDMEYPLIGICTALIVTDIAGGKLKSTGTFWIEPNNCATNEVGFNALPGGYRGGGFTYPSGFFNVGIRAVFWSSTSGSWSGEAYHNQLVNTNCVCSINTYNPSYYKNAGESIRCIKDNCYFTTNFLVIRCLLASTQKEYIPGCKPERSRETMLVPEFIRPRLMRFSV